MKKIFHWLYRKRRKIAVGMLSLPILAYALLYLFHWLFPYPYLLLNAPHSLEIYDCKGNLLMSFLDKNGNWNYPVKLNQITPMMQKAIICAEDKNFYSHNGVDVIALIRAFGGNITGWRKYSGASTITMQTVRLIEPRPRTLRSKVIEAFRAWQLEKILTKDQILEIYLNRTPYGRNLAGVEAAARCYFDKSAKDLSIAESALLAGLPQSPTGYRPDRHLKRCLIRRNYVLQRMADDKVITQEQAKEFAQEKPNISPYTRHFSAAHWCFMLQKKYPTARQLNTTLDPQIQTHCELALRRGIAKYQWRDISNGMVIVADNKTGAIKAWVGSVNFFANEIQGQINGGVTKRSPGSLLKSFTYLLAFDKGLATPSTVLYDIELVTSDYRPANYDREFTGLVTTRRALRASLNLPVIRVQQQLGTKQLLEFYQKIGLTSLTQPPEYYGLTLTLGTSEVMPLEIAQAYSNLARQGSFIPLSCLESELQPLVTNSSVSVPKLADNSSVSAQPLADNSSVSAQKLADNSSVSAQKLTDNSSVSAQKLSTHAGETKNPARLFSEQAGFLVTDILADREPLIASGIYFTQDCPKFAWKTGTSSGNRDAWAVVYNPKWTIVVWLGNFNNRGSKSLVGIETSAPIACDILQQLPEQDQAWYPTPTGVHQRTVCSVSGDLPVAGRCLSAMKDLAIHEVSPEKFCNVHVAVNINPKTGYATCPYCAEANDKTVIKERWPVYVTAWLKQHRQDANLEPIHNPQCSHIKSQEITIAKPATNSQYTLQAGETQYIELQAFSTDNVTLYWFQNGQYLTQTQSGQSFAYQLRIGHYELTCANESGQQAKTNISVK